MDTQHLLEEATLKQATESWTHIEIMLLENIALTGADGQIRTGHLIDKSKLKKISKTLEKEVTIPPPKEVKRNEYACMWTHTHINILQWLV